MGKSSGGGLWMGRGQGSEEGGFGAGGLEAVDLGR